MRDEKLTFQEAEQRFVQSLSLFTETLIEAQRKISGAYEITPKIDNRGKKRRKIVRGGTIKIEKEVKKTPPPKEKAKRKKVFKKDFTENKDFDETSIDISEIESNFSEIGESLSSDIKSLESSQNELDASIEELRLVGQDLDHQSRGIIRTIGGLGLNIIRGLGTFSMNLVEDTARQLSSAQMTNVSAELEEAKKNIKKAFTIGMFGGPVAATTAGLAGAMMGEIISSAKQSFAKMGLIKEDLGKEEIPEFQEGGIVPGKVGKKRLIKAHGKELVLNYEQQEALFETLNRLPESITELGRNIPKSTLEETGFGFKKIGTRILPIAGGGYVGLQLGKLISKSATLHGLPSFLIPSFIGMLGSFATFFLVRRLAESEKGYSFLQKIGNIAKKTREFRENIPMVAGGAAGAGTFSSSLFSALGQPAARGIVGGLVGVIAGNILRESYVAYYKDIPFRQLNELQKIEMNIAQLTDFFLGPGKAVRKSFMREFLEDRFPFLNWLILGGVSPFEQITGKNLGQWISFFNKKVKQLTEPRKKEYKENFPTLEKLFPLQELEKVGQGINSLPMAIQTQTQVLVMAIQTASAMLSSSFQKGVTGIIDEIQNISETFATSVNVLTSLFEGGTQPGKKGKKGKKEFRFGLPGAQPGPVSPARKTILSALLDTPSMGIFRRRYRVQLTDDPTQLLQELNKQFFTSLQTQTEQNTYLSDLFKSGTGKTKDKKILPERGLTQIASDTFLNIMDLLLKIKPLLLLGIGAIGAYYYLIRKYPWINKIIEYIGKTASIFGFGEGGITEEDWWNNNITGFITDIKNKTGAVAGLLSPMNTISRSIMSGFGPTAKAAGTAKVISQDIGTISRTGKILDVGKQVLKTTGSIAAAPIVSGIKGIAKRAPILQGVASFIESLSEGKSMTDAFIGAVGETAATQVLSGLVMSALMAVGVPFGWPLFLTAGIITAGANYFGFGGMAKNLTIKLKNFGYSAMSEIQKIVSSPISWAKGLIFGSESSEEEEKTRKAKESIPTPIQPQKTNEPLKIINTRLKKAVAEEKTKPEIPIENIFKTPEIKPRTEYEKRISSLLSDDTFKEITKLAAKYESGGKASAISAITGDPGGMSYGLWQLNKDTVIDFLHSPEGRPFRKYFVENGSLNPGSLHFNQTWKALSITNDNESIKFLKAQEDYIFRTHFKGLFEYAADKIPYINDLGIASALFSMSVQHGQAKKIVDKVYQEIQKTKKTYTPLEIIDLLYSKRSEYVKGLPNLNENIKKNIIERYIRESEDAILLTLRNYGSSAHRELEKQYKIYEENKELFKRLEPLLYVQEEGPPPPEYEALKDQLKFVDETGKPILPKIVEGEDTFTQKIANKLRKESYDVKAYLDEYLTSMSPTIAEAKMKAASAISYMTPVIEEAYQYVNQKIDDASPIVAEAKMKAASAISYMTPVIEEAYQYVNQKIDDASPIVAEAKVQAASIISYVTPIIKEAYEKVGEAIVNTPTEFARIKDTTSGYLPDATQFLEMKGKVLEVLGKKESPLETQEKINEIEQQTRENNTAFLNNRLNTGLNNIESTLKTIPKNTAESLTPLFTNMNSQVINLIQNQSNSNISNPNSGMEFNINYGIDLLPILIGSLE